MKSTAFAPGGRTSEQRPLTTMRAQTRTDSRRDPAARSGSSAGRIYDRSARNAAEAVIANGTTDTLGVARTRHHRPAINDVQSVLREL